MFRRKKKSQLSKDCIRIRNRRVAKSFEQLENRVVLSATAILDGAAQSDPAVEVAGMRFAMLGDFGDNSSAEAQVAAMVRGQNPDFIITAGDNRYGSSTYQQTITDHYGQYVPAASGGTATENLFFPAPGNHDYDDGGGIGEYLAYFDLPGAGVLSTNTSGTERYYDVIKGDVQFFFVDSDAAISDPLDLAEQQSWLETQMTGSSTRWQVVVLHHAPYSSGGHGSNTTMQWDYASWGADAVLAGHDHTYERISQNGIPFFVNGLGGRSIYAFGSSVPGSEFQYNADYGAMLIEANSSTMTFEFMDVSGSIIDSFTVGDAPPPPPSGVVDRQISLSTDDAEERASDGLMDLTSSDIELGDDPGFNEDQTVGLRFQDIVVPQGAVITGAYLEFETDEIDSAETFVSIRAEASDNALTFSSAANDITSRAVTSSVVGWSIAPWDAVDAVHQTPDLSSLIQEVVDRAGWSSGNSIALIIEGAGSRTAESFDGEALAAAKLHVEYTVNVAPTLAAHWTLDEGEGTSAADSSGNGNTAFFAGDPTWTLGLVGNGVEFDGSGEYISISTPVYLEGDWSFATWVNAADVGSVSMLAGGATTSLQLEQLQDSGRVGFSENGVADHVFDYSAPIGQWVHLAFVKTDSEMSLYADGSLVSTNPNVIALDVATLGGGDALAGILDDVRVYDGALSPEAIAALYQEQVNFNPDAMDDVAGTTVGVAVAISVLGNDSDGNGDTLTIESFTQPANGIVTDNGDGSLLYTPNLGFLGEDNFSYTITDSRGGTDNASVSVTVGDSTVSTIQFSGREWDVKASGDSLMGPGPNYFSNSSSDVWVDSNGELHLNISYRDGRWYSSEIISKEILGYGTYTFTLGSRVDQLDPNIVVGLFTWDTDAPEYEYREIDIEFSRWGDPDYFNSSYTVQPYTTAGNTYPWETTLLGTDSTHSFSWYPDHVDFASYQGDPAEQPIKNWTYSGTDVPPAGTAADGANARINFWLFGGAPSDGQEAELIVKSFEFTPWGENAGPVAMDDYAVTQVGTPVSITPLSNDSDPDGDAISLVSVSGVDNGTYSVDGNQIVFSPNPGFVGTEVFDYIISDVNGATATASIMIDVLAPSTPPSPNPMGFAQVPFLNESISTSLVATMVALTATDPDGGVEYYFDNLEANEGEWWNGAEDSGWQSSESFSDWNLQPDFTYHYRVKARDAWGNETDWSPVASLQIEQPNQSPQAVQDVISTLQGQSVEISVLENDSDPDGDPLSIVSVTQPQNGTVVNTGNGVLLYSPNASFGGTDLFQYTVSDGRGGTSTADVLVTVESPPQTFLYDDYALSMNSVAGFSSGDLSDTYFQDDQLLTVSEELYQRNRKTRLEQQWVFNVTGGDLGVQFHARVGHDSVAESFLFQYDSGSGWLPLIAIADTAMTDYSVSLPTNISGLVTVRALDTDQSRGENTVDHLLVDQIRFVSERSNPLPPRVSIFASPDQASEDQSTVGAFTISLADSIPLTQDLTVLYTVGGTASEQDYAESLNGSVLIPAGQLSTTLSITALDDPIQEDTEDVVMRLIADSAYLPTSVDEAIVSIVDNDTTEIYASSSVSVFGSVSGTLDNIRAVDGSYQTLTEERYGGGSRRSRLEHQWIFDLSGLNQVEFLLDAELLTPNDPDQFEFSYSLDGGLSWASLVTLSPSSGTSHQLLVDTTNGSGEVLVRVRDTDSSRDKSSASLRIDRLMFRLPTAMSGSNVDQFYSSI